MCRKLAFFLLVFLSVQSLQGQDYFSISRVVLERWRETLNESLIQERELQKSLDIASQELMSLRQLYQKLERKADGLRDSLTRAEKSVQELEQELEELFQKSRKLSVQNKVLKITLPIGITVGIATGAIVAGIIVWAVNE